MRARTLWRWNPVRGEYESGPPPVVQGTGEISAVDAFRNCTLLLMGGTGFVGKVFLAMTLERFPELKHLVVQVRRKKNVSGEQRFYNDILNSPPVRPTVDRLGGVNTLREKITVLEGDLDEPLCGISAERIEQLKGKIDIIVNLAGVVDFDPPVNESFETNVYGTQHLIALVQLLDTKLVHVSTCYVAGKRNGRIPEGIDIEGYFPRRDTAPNEHFSIEQELDWYERFVKETRESRDTNPRPVRERLREGGMNRADYWGWTNTYTYTKSMGEQLIARTQGLRYCIVRPAIVESSMEFPFPGWNEGFTTSAPLVLMGGEGVKGWPVRKDGPLEVIPVDLVAQGILIVAAAMLSGKSKRIYHLASADENPIMLPRLVSFLGMNARYKHKHKKEGNRLANAWKAYVETQVISVESLQARRQRLHRGLDIIHAALTLGKTLFGGPKIDPYLKSLRDTRRQIRAQEITLDKFLPFMFHNSFIFETRNIRETAKMLTNEDLKRVRWNPESIDWADYWVNIHTKGIERWIRPMFASTKKTGA
ncbi:MAG TPA: SDR family oxidoreductase [Terriglobia bacterium]|nr:SDR family oxidoreductase [Terriglobia bacterium]